MFTDEQALFLDDCLPHCPEHWMWVAHYHDGDILPEYGPLGQHLTFNSINQPLLDALILLPTKPTLQAHVLKVDPESGQRPIFFRRRFRRPNDDMILPSDTIHALGWQRTVNGKNVASFAFLYWDGSMVISDDRNAV